MSKEKNKMTLNTMSYYKPLTNEEWNKYDVVEVDTDIFDANTKKKQAVRIMRVRERRFREKTLYDISNNIYYNTKTLLTESSHIYNKYNMMNYMQFSRTL